MSIGLQGFERSALGVAQRIRQLGQRKIVAAHRGKQRALRRIELFDEGQAFIRAADIIESYLGALDGPL